MSQKIASDELLNLLFWSAEKLMMPTFRNLTESYEGWEYRNFLRHELRSLQRRNLLSKEDRAEGIVYRVTELGRLTAMGGRDPNDLWNRRWDGYWRMLLFDLPARRKQLRQRLWRWLRENHFGYLQNSVWITPDPVTEVLEAIQEFRNDVESFTVMESRCCGGRSDESIVEGAWDFEAIHDRYRDYLALPKPPTVAGAELTEWLHRERVAWMRAVELDPFLPRALLPKDYPGAKAWEVRCRTMRNVGKRLMR